MTDILSRRQWTARRVRTLAAVILALGLLIPGGSAFAQEKAEPLDRICVEGSVINFDETPLGAPYTWTITYGPAGTTDTYIVTTDADGQFSLPDAEGPMLEPGVWTFSLNPTGPWEGLTPLTFDVPLGYGGKECVQIRWKLVRYVPVIVTKIDEQHNPLNGWVIRAEPARGNRFASPQEVTTGSGVNRDGEAVFRLTEGQWIFTERAPGGVVYTPIMPAGGQQTLNVVWQTDEQGAPEPLFLRFKNRVTEYGCIEVSKFDLFEETSTPLPGWKITLKRANGSVAATGYTDAAGKVTFNNLPFGPYTVHEEIRNGWTPVSPTSFSVTVDVAGECIPVKFFNKQDFGFSFIGRKLDANGHVGLAGWKITITPLDAGGAMPTNGTPEGSGAYVLTDGLGNYRFDFPTNDYRVPGARYRICEELKVGWLPHGPTCYNVRLPHQPGSPVMVKDFVNQQVGHTESKRWSSSPGGSGCRYTVTVRPGESLYGIGAAYGASPSAMLAANPWVRNRPHYYLYPGDTVCVP
ncbi:MAG: SpaA isopeptide-forming pilin-related protein [Caldilinea sp.]|nr:SpaA isopeptide-forming pilin-related protein [Caldilinea sp.]MDW8441919.1 SpaA isopeptide-forming pilin-related protein [Caldilineaceae bacterium]